MHFVTETYCGLDPYANFDYNTIIVRFLGSETFAKQNVILDQLIVIKIQFKVPTYFENDQAKLCQAQLSQKLQLKLQSKLAVEAEVIPYFSGWVVGGWVVGDVENIAISAFN